MDNYLSKERVKHLARLSNKKYRKEDRSIVVEGENIIEQLVSNGIYPQELFIRDHYRIAFEVGNIPVFLVCESDMGRICDTRSPQAIAALYEIPDEKEVLYDMALYLDGIQDPGNMGTIFRSAAAFGVKQIYLSPGSCEVFSPKVVRASLGSVFWIPSAVRDYDWLRQQKLTILSTGVETGIPLRRLSRPDKCVIVIGSEAQGVSNEVKEISNQSIRIEMRDSMESINASVATSIILWWFCTQRDDCN